MDRVLPAPSQIEWFGTSLPAAPTHTLGRTFGLCGGMLGVVRQGVTWRTKPGTWKGKGGGGGGAGVGGSGVGRWVGG